MCVCTYVRMHVNVITTDIVPAIIILQRFAVGGRYLVCLTSVIYSKLLSSYLNLKSRCVRSFIHTYVRTYMRTCPQCICNYVHMYIRTYVYMHYYTLCTVRTFVYTIRTVCKYSIHMFVHVFGTHMYVRTYVYVCSFL